MSMHFPDWNFISDSSRLDLGEPIGVFVGFFVWPSKLPLGHNPRTADSGKLQGVMYHLLYLLHFHISLYFYYTNYMLLLHSYYDMEVRYVCIHLENISLSTDTARRCIHTGRLQH